MHAAGSLILLFLHGGKPYNGPVKVLCRRLAQSCLGATMKRKAVAESVKAGGAQRARLGEGPNETKQSEVAAADGKRYVAQCVLLEVSPLSYSQRHV